jgi:hypothetical protein
MLAKETMPEDIPTGKITGSSTIHINGLAYDVVREAAYVAQRKAIIEKAVPLQAHVFDRNEFLQRQFVMESLATDKDALKGGATAIFVREPGENSPYIAVGVHRQISVSIENDGVIPVLYGGRAVEDEYRGGGVGKTLTELAIAFSRAKYLSYRGQNPVSPRSVEKSDRIQEGMHLPWDHLYDFDEEERKQIEEGTYTGIYKEEDLELMQEIMVKIFFGVKRNGKVVDWSTGVSKGDLGRRNPAVPENPNDQKYAVDTRKYMTEVLKVNFDRADSVTTVAKLKT